LARKPSHPAAFPAAIRGGGSGGLTEGEAVTTELQADDRPAGSPDPPARRLSIRAAKRRVREAVRQAERLYRELGELESALPAPAPEDYERMASGDRPLSVEAHLLGALRLAAFHLREACDVTGHVDRIPARASPVADRILRALRQVIEMRAQGRLLP